MYALMRYFLVKNVRAYVRMYFSQKYEKRGIQFRAVSVLKLNENKIVQESSFSRRFLIFYDRHAFLIDALIQNIYNSLQRSPSTFLEDYQDCEGRISEYEFLLKLHVIIFVFIKILCNV